MDLSEYLSPNQVIDLKELVNHLNWPSYRMLLTRLEQEAARRVMESDESNFIQNKSFYQGLKHIREVTDSLHAKLEELKEKENAGQEDRNWIDNFRAKREQQGLTIPRNPADEWPRESAY